MSPILCLVASCLLQGAQIAPPPPPEADPVIGWARVEFDANGITRAEAGGFADLETMRPLTVDDPVRIASVSKLVVALGAMRLVEAGTLDLDADVSDYLGWPLRNPAFPDIPITLRHLLGHRAGIRDDAGYALPLDADLEQWLTQEGAWNTEHDPGQWFSYANLNFPVVAAAMEGATGERFDRIMAREVFEPLELDACFNWTTCSAETRARAVVLYEPDGTAIRDTQQFIAEDCHATPASDGSCDLDSYVLARNGAAFSPQGGLRISARDLARIGVALLNDGAGLFSDPATLPDDVIEVAFDARPSVRFFDSEGGFYCQYRLGLHTIPTLKHDCDSDLFGSLFSGTPNERQFRGHAGEAYGLRSGVWFSGQQSRGVAYFATGLPETGALPGRSAFTAIEEGLAQGAPVETFVPEGAGDDEEPAPPQPDPSP